MAARTVDEAWTSPVADIAGQPDLTEPGATVAPEQPTLAALREEEKPAAAAPELQAPAPVSVPPTPAPAYALPIDALQATVSAAGLQWVQSDPEAIRRAQETLAAMPASIRVPRERNPVPRPDDGPLILVETARPLPALQLPENAQPR
ncbi:hypothetical protein GALL_511630 [mine drainage metagenome]|uniref:Uncharacterized protein n=1 Tax=mine drainage metagenome TaxID=410659 RepID=A0A1J5PUP4_9ZZZZ